MTQPGKRQKLDLVDAATLRVEPCAEPSSTHEAVSGIKLVNLIETVPEPSGNSEASLTEAALVLRRKQYLERLCTLYQAQLQDILRSTKHTIDGKTQAVASEIIVGNNTQTLPNLKTALPFVSRSEQVSAAAVNRELDAKRGLAMLCGKQARYVINSTAVDLGRSTSAQGKVDVDLSEEGDAKKVSRKQAHLRLCADGKFTLANTGRRAISVNGLELVQHSSINLDHLSFIDLAGIHLLFMINQSAVRRLVSRSQNLVL